MVANLSSHKRGWDDRWHTFSDWAVRGQRHKAVLLRLVDEDTRAFGRLMEAYRAPAASDAEKAQREARIQAATIGAVEAPLQVMREALAAMDLVTEMAASGMSSSASDAGVGALCCRAAVRGGGLNVRINVPGITDTAYRQRATQEAEALERAAEAAEAQILALVAANLEKAAGT
jgi:glutamate formiminotransferase/formiminotetrahydrofolate cyclodeaminase